MNTQKREIAICFIKNNGMNWTISQQTKNIREKTNKKIRTLGNKYYIIKNIFDRLKFKRDDLFEIAKELETEYQKTKQNIHLQNQIRRMKEAMVCWYCENFFEEIVQPNSALIRKMIEMTNGSSLVKSSHSQTKTKKSKNSSTKSKSNTPTTIQISKKPKKNEKNHQNNNFDFSINQEIDSFDPTTMITDNSFYENTNENFNFEKFLNF
ncbi:hypothetical protein M9Y10_032136 [Tritrichomonas musculus]|uniref:Uncharacterized protein n=1 Tax=Tritrichomonas musculus TaxID=1915356 RepID=A0ABR2H0N9_9EUKA